MHLRSANGFVDIFEVVHRTCTQYFPPTKPVKGIIPKNTHVKCNKMWKRRFTHTWTHTHTHVHRFNRHVKPYSYSNRPHLWIKIRKTHRHHLCHISYNLTSQTVKHNTSEQCVRCIGINNGGQGSRSFQTLIYRFSLAFFGVWVCAFFDRSFVRFLFSFKFSFFNTTRGYKMHYLMYFMTFPLNYQPLRLSNCLSASRYFGWLVRRLANRPASCLALINVHVNRLYTCTFSLESWGKQMCSTQDELCLLSVTGVTVYWQPTYLHA